MKAASLPVLRVRECDTAVEINGRVSEPTATRWRVA